MSDLIARSLRVLTALKDGSGSQARRVDQAAQCYHGLMLSDLNEDVKERFTGTLARTVSVTRAYDFQDGKSLDIMSTEDLEKYQSILLAAAQDAITDECERLIAELDRANDYLPVKTVHEIREHRTLMIPALRRCIEEAAEELRDGDETQIGNAAFFALYLLSEFEAKEALPTLLEVLSRPGEVAFDLFGDTITEGLSSILAQLALPQLDCLTPLIENRKANQYVRGAAVQAYVHAYAAQKITRQAALSELGKWLQAGIAQNDHELVTSVVCSLSDIAPGELLTEIQSAFQAGLVDRSVISLAEVVDAAESLEDGLWLSEFSRLGFADCLQELKGWSMFQDKPKKATPPLNSSTIFQSSAAQPNLRMVESAKETRVVRPGRNDPCPCASGRKFKKCCGK